MRLLLVEMWPAWMAERLRASSHDVQAVLERPELVGRSDRVVFELAQSEGRAVLTENVPDYRRRAAQALEAGEVHHGLVFTSNRSRRPLTSIRSRRR